MSIREHRYKKPLFLSIIPKIHFVHRRGHKRTANLWSDKKSYYLTKSKYNSLKVLSGPTLVVFLFLMIDDIISRYKTC